MDWHATSIQDTLRALDVTVDGLAQSAASSRLQKYGVNDIQVSQKQSIWKKILNQFHNTLIYILLIAAVITAFLQHFADSAVILGVVVINAVIGYFQEGKAQEAIAALQKLLVQEAIVLRDGKKQTVPVKLLVPGDTVLLRAGDKVPADVRLIKTHALQVDESILTGESLPVEKSSSAVSKDTPLMQRQSMAYSGTFVTYGRGVGVVVATGESTELGKISVMIKGIQKISTPLLKQITIFSHWIGIGITVIALFLFLFGVIVHGYSYEKMFMVAVAVAVAMIPEGLPAIITIILAIGVTRMAKRHAIVRKLPSVETLSAVTVVCTDKTGTLTKNELTASQVVTPDGTYMVTGAGYNDEGEILKTGNAVDVDKSDALQMLVKAAVLCNEATLKQTDDQWQLMGSSVDGALLSLGLKSHLSSSSANQHCPQTDLIPFDSRHKFMATLHHDHEGSGFIFIKGAPEKVIEMAKRDDQAEWLAQVEQMAQKGLRVLGLAMKKTDQSHVTLSFDDINDDIIFLGLIGIMDPPRSGVKEAIANTYQAGINIKMITGDHALTAKAIASLIGMRGNHTITGEQLDLMSDDQLDAHIDQTDIFARTTPEHKLRLVHALRKKQHIIAMTGDGINDAPALKSADIGIAMGKKGTEVARESAEIILADDNFASIEQGIEQARNVYKNLKKAILFILPGNAAEGLVILLTLLFGYTLPITPLQILWVNMVTAVSLGLALAFEPAEDQLMLANPRSPGEKLLSSFLIWRLLFISLLFFAVLFGLFRYEMMAGKGIAFARTTVVNLLVFLEVVYLLNCRRMTQFAMQLSCLKTIKPALIAIGVVLLLQVGFTYLPFMQFVFSSKNILLTDWLWILGLSVAVFFIIEGEKKILHVWTH